MAVRSATINYPSNNISVVWSGLLNGDTGLPVYAADYPEKHIQITGAFGVGGTVVLEGSSDGGTTWAKFNRGLIAQRLNDIVIDRTDAIYAGSYGGVFRSIDNGRTWTERNKGL